MEKAKVLGFITLILVTGSLAIAIIDPTTRTAFNDLAKIAVGAYMGFLIPRAGA